MDKIKIQRDCIVVKTGYGQGNAPDDAVLEHYVKLFPNNQIVALCRNPNNYLNKSFGDRVVFVGGLQHPTFAEARGRNLRGFNYGDGLETANTLTEIFVLAKLLIIGHGSYFNEHHLSIGRGALSEVLFYTQLAVATKTPYVLYHLSASDYILQPFNRFACRFILDNAYKVILRDSHTRVALERSCIPVSRSKTLIASDLVLGDVTFEPILGFRGGTVLGIVPRRLRHLSDTIDAKVENGLRKCIERWLDHDSKNRVRLIPNLRAPDDCDYNNDYTYVYELQTGFPVNRVSVWDVGQPCTDVGTAYWRNVLKGYLDLDQVIAIRHHGGIFGLLAKVPVIHPVNYDFKVQGFWSDFGNYQTVPLDLVGDIDFVNDGYRFTKDTASKIESVRLHNKKIHDHTFNRLKGENLSG